MDDSEERRLSRNGGRWRKAEVAVRLGRRGAAPRGALEEAVLHEEGLVHLLDRELVLADCRGDGLHAHGAAIELLDDGLEDAGVHVVESELVDIEHGERRIGELARNAAVPLHLRVVAYAAQEPVGNTRRPAR